MRISDIISLAKEYLKLGIAAVILTALIFAVGYFIVYKRILKGQKKLTAGKTIWGAFFLCYLVVVVGATMLSRGSFYENEKILPLFYSYREAWTNWSAVGWRNIILNILLFVPLGFLLPLGIKKFQRFWAIYLAGLFLTVAVETLQLILKRGIFELDDILDNLLGTMIGYGCFAIWRWIAKRVKKEKAALWKMIALQIPLLAVIIMFAGIFTAYETKELGNLKGSSFAKYRGEFAIKTTENYSEEAGTELVYKSAILRVEETRQLAEDFFTLQGWGFDESRTDIYESTAIYHSDKNTSLWIDYTGGTYNYTDFDLQFGDEIAVKEDADETEIRRALKAYGIEVPKTAEFQKMSDGEYWFTVNEYTEGNKMYDGTIICTYYENGRLGNINNHLIAGEAFKEYPVISEQEAYKQLCDGMFRYYAKEKFNITTGKVFLKHRIDTKGFCQPVYIFEADIDGAEAAFEVSALK